MPDDPILPIDHPLLSRPSAKVTEFGDGIRELAEEMLAIMDRERGAGLAAVQIGKPVRLVVMDVSDANGERHRLAMVNPKVTEKSEESITESEGCLSMPGYDIPVSRHAEVTVEFQDPTGKEHRRRASGLFAVCVQHEVDHTNGVLFFDRASRLRRQRAKSYFKKVRREAERAA